MKMGYISIMTRKYTINDAERKRRSERMVALNQQVDLSLRATKTNEIRRKNREHLQERIKKANEILTSMGLDTV